MNENHIGKVKIGNFKSIIDLEFDCKRVNLFIGKPNVGKSNILEAMGVHNFQAFISSHYKKDFKQSFHLNLKDFINFRKLKSIRNKFMRNGGLTTTDIFVGGKNLKCAFLLRNNNTEPLKIIYHPWFNKTGDRKNNLCFDESGALISGANQSDIISKTSFYKFKKDLEFENNNFPMLDVPYGHNLLKLISNNQYIYERLEEMINEYGYEMLTDDDTEQFEIQRREGKRIYKIPYHFLADTLRRYIFHYAAIESNKNATLLFEEPEAHCYIEYVKMLAWDMIKSESNQFFVTTHSPTVISTIVENMDINDYTINIVYYEDYQTKIHQLTKAEIQDSIDYNYDLLLNLDDFIKEKVNA